MFELKTLTEKGIPAALEKAERYRLLNEPAEAESICLDVLKVAPDNQEAITTLLLAVTDRRLLWLLDDAPTHRVRSLPYTAIAEIDHRLRRPRRKVAVLRVRTKNERTHSFSELRPATAAEITGHVAAARLAAIGAAS